MTAHTPGPWTTDGDRIDSMDHWVAEAVAPSLGVRRADARLIAAAPDLLAALKATVAADAESGADDNYLAAARAAIARAEDKP